MPPKPPEKPFLEFDRGRTVKGRGLSLPERLRAARRVPQAVVKVISYGKGRYGAEGLLQYISRNGRLELETDQGERLRDFSERKALVQSWAGSFDRRKNSRDTVHIVFSMPHGSDPDALRRSVRKVLKREFEGHFSAFGVHTDQKHPHAHVALVLRARGQAKKRDLRKGDLYRLREVFAEAAREEGVELAASPRAARGVGRKGARMAAYQLRQKKNVPVADKETAKEVLAELERGHVEEKPWEKTMRERNARERQAYRDEAKRLRDQARSAGNDRDLLLKAASDLDRFAKEMPEPRTHRQSILEGLGQPLPGHQRKTTNRESGNAGLDR